ncbi:TonB-dependent siderophore receptor [Flavobacterium sp. W21_SRS_FM6]|uniref:TonB-dependent siderophore receptor n=1 Tax=Flavobacterium sp. W21_SRS_FM6 TaxID=3240268 RepID=UPI003F92199A
MKLYNKVIVTTLSIAGTSVSFSLVAGPKEGEADLDSAPIEKIEVVQHRQPFRGDIPLKELPQSIQTISSERLLDAGITDFQSSLSLSSGIAAQNSFGGLWDSFAIRGFAGDENLPSGYLINGFSAGRGFSGRRDTSNIQSIEILKGPGSALYGRSEPGGTINILTKKPVFSEQGYLQASVASYDNYRVEGDYSNALNEQLAYRVNGAYKDADSFRDTIDSQSLSLTPSILFKLSDTLQLNYELEFLDQETPFDRGIVVLNNDFDTVPRERFFGEPNDGPMQVKALGHQLTVEQKFNENWDMLYGFGYRTSSFDGYSTEVELSTGRQILYLDNKTVSRQRRYRDYDARDSSARFELSGHIQTGELLHHVLIGADAYDYSLDQIQQRWRSTWGGQDSTYSVNLNSPVYGQAQPEVSPNTDRQEKQSAFGVYLQDQIDLSAHWRMLVGFRFDKFEQNLLDRLHASKEAQSQTATSPRLGLVYQGSASYSMYLSYSEGFRPNSGTTSEGKAFKPEHSQSYEAGIKFGDDATGFSGTFAMFKAQKSNILTAEPNGSGESFALGEAQSQGLELDLQAALGADTSLHFAYAYTDAQTGNDMVNLDWGVTIPRGSQLINIPKNSANLTLQHFTQLGGYDAKIGTSVNYVGERLGDTIEPNYILPNYTTVGVFTSLNISNNLVASVNIDNLFDAEYFVSSYSALWTMPGTARTIQASLRYEF